MRKFNNPFIENNFYHVFNRAIGSEKMFTEHGNYDYFLKKMQQHILPVADIFCCAFLPNHFHLFVRIKPLSEINALFTAMKPKILQAKYDENLSLFTSEQFGNWCNAYTKAFNKRYDRKGKLFMDNLNRKLIDTESYFSKTVHYIHANAAQHGLCNSVQTWPYSSYHELLANGKTWLAREEVLAWFGGRKGFVDFHKQPIIKKASSSSNPEGS